MGMKLIGRLMVFDGKAWVEQPAEFLVDSEIDLDQEAHDRMMVRAAERIKRGDELAEQFTNGGSDRFGSCVTSTQNAITFILDRDLPSL